MPRTGDRPAAGAPDPRDRPPVNRVFQFYHLMVGIGFGMIALALAGLPLLLARAALRDPLAARLLVLSVLGPQIANQAGWFAAEMGRQPWIVYGLLRTADGLSAVVKAEAVLGSLILFTWCTCCCSPSSCTCSTTRSSTAPTPPT
jgi:cytochrome d ubiquinol oxidase subunit I